MVHFILVLDKSSSSLKIEMKSSILFLEQEFFNENVILIRVFPRDNSIFDYNVDFAKFSCG